jgi:hypothetical protein
MTDGADVGGNDTAASQGSGSLSSSWDGPVGIGGWLVIPILGLIVSPFVAAVQARDLIGIGDAWPFLSTPHAAFIIVETTVNVLLSVIAPIILLVLAFERLEIFPPLYVIWVGAFPVFLIADAILGYWMFRELYEADGKEMFDKETVRSLSRSIWVAAIWIPYMMRSRRVDNTFVK